MASAIITGRQVSTSASHLHSATAGSDDWIVGIYNRQTAFSFCGVFIAASGSTGGTGFVAGGEIPPQRIQNFALPRVESGQNLWGSAASASGHLISVWQT